MFLVVCTESGGSNEDRAGRGPCTAEATEGPPTETGGRTTNETGAGKSPAAVRLTLSCVF